MVTAAGYVNTILAYYQFQKTNKSVFIVNGFKFIMLSVFVVFAMSFLCNFSYSSSDKLISSKVDVMLTFA